MRIAVYGDTHFPFHDQGAIDLAHDVVKDFKPDLIVQIGDLKDQFSFSKYAKNQSSIRMTPQQEAKQARAEAEMFFADLRKVSKKADIVCVLGNHDTRIVRQICDKAPELTFVASEWLKGYHTFKGVRVINDSIIVDNIMFEHGCRKMGQHAPFNQMNTCTGHFHKAQIKYFSNIDGPFWEFNVGWLGDVCAPVYSYKESSKINDTHIGVGLIENGQPRFVSL